MCDYSLRSVKSRPAKVADALVTRDFGTGTRGFGTLEDPTVVVCIRPGTELSFTSVVICLRTGLLPWRKKVIQHTTAIFRQINRDRAAASANVEDDRDASASRGMPCGAGGLGIGVVIIVTLVGWYLGIDPDLQSKFGACSNSKACQFSEAYIIAHEVGHHVQNELGILPCVTQAQQAASSQTEANALQVRVELQGDCLAGVWANRAQQKHKFLDPGDVDQALQTATAIGDDRLQKERQGYVVRDSFTHGTAEQRKRWFMNGLTGGSVASCDTFGPQQL